MKKIGIFLGNFNPPTVAHFIVANQALNFVDYVWFVPFINDKLAHIEQMLSLSIQETKQKRFILHQARISDYSDIFEMLEKNINIPSCEFFIIAGMDTFLQMPKWKNAIELDKKYKFIVAKRGEKEETNKKEDDILIEGYTTISSEIVRDNIKKNINIKFLVPDSVRKYLKKNKIY